MSKNKPVPTGYKASDVALRRDNGEVVTKDGKVWRLSEGVWVNGQDGNATGQHPPTVTFQPGEPHGGGKAPNPEGPDPASPPVPPTPGQGTNDIPPTTVNTPNGPITTEHEDVVTKLRGDHPKLNAHLENSDEEHRRKDEEIARLKAEMSGLKASRRGEHEGKPAGGPDAPTTDGVRMAGKYPHKTEDMPTVDQLNKAGQ